MAPFRRKQFEADLDEELKFHLDMLVEQNVKAGMSPEQAEAEARRAFGGVERVKDEVRDAKGFTLFDNVLRDLRFAVRTLRRSKAFLGIAVLCLALGMGANTALFTVVNAVLLRPLPFPHSDRLFRAFETEPQRDGNWQGSLSYPNFVDWRAEVRSFRHLVAYSSYGMNVRSDSGTVRVRSTAASEGFFDLLGPRFLLGRAFHPEEHQPGRGQVVVLNERLWRRWFDASPRVIGSKVQLEGQSYEVVGVVAELPFPIYEPSEIYVPLNPVARERESRGTHWMSVVGALSANATFEEANAELQSVAARIERDYPEQLGRSGVVEPWAEYATDSVRPGLLMLLGAVGFVLLIACANVANLLLAKAANRRHEMALRLALGASRRRVVSQLLVESWLLSFLGSLFGLLIAVWSLAAMRPYLEDALPFAERITLDTRVLGFTFALSIVTTLLFGLVPALQCARADLRTHLSEAGTHSSSRSTQRIRSGLVIAEVALTLMLLVGAGLLVRSFIMMMRTPSGIRTDGVLTAHLAPPWIKDADSRTVVEKYKRVLERVRAMPGVDQAGLISLLPIQDAWSNFGYDVEGQPVDPLNRPQAESRVSSAGIFGALGIPLLEGRGFSEMDTRGANILVNEALARKHFPKGEAVGRRLLLGKTAFTIIGVVGNTRQAGLRQLPLPEVHFPFDHPETLAGERPELTLVLHTQGSPEQLASTLLSEIRVLDPEISVFRIQTMDEVISKSVTQQRLQLILISAFAVIALFLAGAGLYGVLSYLVTQRSQEIGVRMALGAQGGDVVRLFVKQGLKLVGVGMVLGLVGSLALGRVLKGALYGVSARDPLTLGALMISLALLSFVATYLPARRAARVDPLLAIKAQ